MKPTVEQVIEKYFPESPEGYHIDSHRFKSGLIRLIHELYQEAYEDGGEDMFIKIHGGVGGYDENHI